MNLGKDHYKVLVRMTVYTECNTGSSQNSTLKTTLDTIPNTFSLTVNT